MITIDFKRWGAGPDCDGLATVQWLAVPRLDETVFVLADPKDLESEQHGEVRKIHWQSDGSVTAWLR